jgi:hypothetical protein
MCLIKLCGGVKVQFLSVLMLAVEGDYVELQTQNASCLWAEFMVHAHWL